jgi:hypothetical protein
MIADWRLQAGASNQALPSFSLIASFAMVANVWL